MELACMKAARKLVFEYLEEKIGYGWWGENKNKDFYDQMAGDDNPWNWIRVLTGGAQRPVDPECSYETDHAGKFECAALEELFPGSIKLERLCETDDWFAQDAVEMSAELGKKMIDYGVERNVKIIKGEIKW